MYTLLQFDIFYSHDYPFTLNTQILNTNVAGVVDMHERSMEIDGIYCTTHTKF